MLLIEYLHAPRDSRWTNAKRILCYIRHTASYGLHLRSALLLLFPPSLMQIGLVALMTDDPRGGYVVFFGPNLIA
jgi:hypothetical protein